jgi:hypothetical protein
MTEKKKSVWETLSCIDVSGHTEEKNGFTYLSWAWAWQVLKDEYPEATFVKHLNPETGLPFTKDPETGTAFVTVTVSSGPSKNGIPAEATETFPVLDYKNSAIVNPNAFQVNTALQRCLAKAISYLGLGAYIYAGEDLPQTPKDKEVTILGEEKGKATEKKAAGADMIFEIFNVFMKSMDTIEKLESFYQSNIEAVRVLQRLDATKYEKMLSMFKKQKQDILSKEKEKA